MGREPEQYYLKDQLGRAHQNEKGHATAPGKMGSGDPYEGDGSIIIVIATDAPVDARNLGRMAARAVMGMAKTGAAGSNGSGDYAIAFSTSGDERIRTAANGGDRNTARNTKSLPNDAMSPLFLAVIESTEEAIYNSLFRATTTTSRGHTIQALPLERTLEILRKHGAIKR